MVGTFIVAACLHFLMTSDALPQGMYIPTGSLPSFPHDMRCPAPWYVCTFLLAVCPHFLMTPGALPHGMYIPTGSLPSFPHDIRCPAPWYVHSNWQPALISS
jgi:hypothetical protein